VRALLLALAVGALAAPAGATTTVYVQDNTPFHFEVTVERSGAPLAGDRWGRGVETLTPGQRARAVWFDRDTGITDGERFTLATHLTEDGSRLVLLQQLLGRTLGSHLWAGL
jgi:hypothetical protein